jgi:WD40 repeat protein
MLLELSHRKLLIPVGIGLVAFILLISFWNGSSELDQAEPTITFPGLAQDRVSALTWGADSSILIAGYSNGKLSVLPISDNRSNLLINENSETITSLTSSPNNLMIGVGYGDGTVEVRSTHNGVLLFEANYHTDWVRSLAWNPTGTMLASSSHDKTVVWNILTDEMLISLEGDMVSLEWAQNSILVGRSLNAQTYVWDVDIKQLLNTINAGTNTAISHDASKLAGAQGNSIMIWRLVDGKVLVNFNDTIPGAIAWSEDGAHIATAYDNISDDFSIDIHDAFTGESALTLTGHGEFVFSLNWLPNGRYLISTSLDDSVRVWDTTTGETINIVRVRQINDPSQAILSPDRTKIAIVADDESVSVWNLFP